MFHFPRMGWVLAAALLLGGIASRGQPFTNGGFEIVSDAPIASNTSRTLNPRDTWLAGWNADGPDGSVIVQNGFLGFYLGSVLIGLDAAEGEQWTIFPDDAAGGSLSQTFQTVVGGYCLVSFAAGYVFTADDPLIGVTVTASDGTVLSNNMYELSYREWSGFELAFIATTTNATLTFTDASTNAEGAWIGLDDVTLVAEPPGWPYIITSPQNQTNAAGTRATFSASAGGSAPTIQWYLGNTALTNATNATLTVIASGATAGSYTAVFSNSAGTNASGAAILTVLQTVAPPTDQTATAGSPVTFTASANLSPAKVQWYFGPYPIPGATSPALAVPANNQTAGTYSARFTVGTATAASAPALLTVLNIPFINGSFEATGGMSIGPGGDQVGNAGDEWLTGWTFGGCTNGVFLFNGSFLGATAADGNQWVVFDSENGPPGGIVSQTFSTTVGHTYVVTFSAMAIYYDGNPFKSLEAAALASDGSLLAGNDVDPPADWAANQLIFTAQTINTTLSFLDTSFPNFGPSVALDAVAVVDSSTPPPPVQVLKALSPQPAPGLFVVRLTGQSGRTYVMQTSTNLTAWVPVSTNLATGSTVNITNALIPGATEQFWRVIPAP